MDTSTIACIGSGNMGFALMKGAVRIIGGGNIGFTDINMDKARMSASTFGAMIFNSNIEAAENSGFIFLAVKPQTLADVLAEIAPVLRRRLAARDAPVLVSMAAGWTIDKIQAAITGNAPVKVPAARIMPNTPALISRGLIAFAASPELSKEQTAELETMLEGAGTVDRVSENYLNAVTGLSGSGPAFVYLFIEALADGGVLAGLPRDKALHYAAQTALGSAAMVLESGRHPGELKDMVCSPGGTAIAGVAALESGAFRSTVIQAVKAAWQRAETIKN